MLAWAWVCLVLALELVATSLIYENTIFHRVDLLHALHRLLPPGERVLLSSGSHPICALDAGYYGTLTIEGVDRLGQAVRRDGWRWDMPPCNYAELIRQERPILIDSRILEVVPVSD